MTSILKSNKIKINENYILKVFILAIVTAIAIFLPFTIKYNGIFIYYSDYIAQQIPFYQLCHQAIRSGEFGFNLLTDLGVDFIASYSFYTLGSPFFWITLPFPNEWLPYMMGPLYILKYGCIAVTGYLYIKMFVKNLNLAVIGGLLYAFCGFNMYNIIYNHFHDVVVFFPLLLISMEKFIREDKKYFFAISVCICCILNYYFFFGQVIFCIIYFFVRINYDDFNVDIKKFSILVLEAVLGLLMACFLLIPSLFVLIGNGRIEEVITLNNMFVYSNHYKYLEILVGLFLSPDVAGQSNIFRNAGSNWNATNVYLPLFSSIGVLALCKYKKKHFVKPLLIICCIFAFVPVLNSLFSALNFAYYSRWFYMPILIMALATMIVIEDNIKNLEFGLKIYIVSVFIFLIHGYFALFRALNFDLLNKQIILSLISVIFIMYLIKIGIENKNFYKITIVMVCSISIIYSNFTMSESVEYLSDEDNQKYAQNVNASPPNLPITLDEQFFRIDTYYSSLTNLPMFWEMPSINSYHSIISNSTFEFYRNIDVGRLVISNPAPIEIGIRALTNVLYRFYEEDLEYVNSEILIDDLGFNYIDTQNGYDIYQNEYFVPFGVGYDYQVIQSQFDDADIHKDRILVGGIYLGYDENGNEYDLLPNIKTDDEQSHLTREQYLINCENLAQNSIKDLNMDSYGFTGTYETDRNQILYISLPYSTGFSATINGEPVDILKANFGFMAVPVEAGINQIEFKYVTPGLMLGIKISMFAFIIFFMYCYITIRLKSKLSYSNFGAKTKNMKYNFSYNEENTDINQPENECSLDEDVVIAENHEIEETEENKDI